MKKVLTILTCVCQLVFSCISYAESKTSLASNFSTGSRVATCNSWQEGIEPVWPWDIWDQIPNSVWDQLTPTQRQEFDTFFYWLPELERGKLARAFQIMGPSMWTHSMVSSMVASIEQVIQQGGASSNMDVSGLTPQSAVNRHYVRLAWVEGLYRVVTCATTSAACQTNLNFLCPNLD